MHLALDSLYRDGNLTLANSANDMPPFDHDRFLSAAQAIYRQRGFTPDMLRNPDIRRLVQHTASILSHAVETHIPTDTDPVTLYALENNAFVFSAFKTYHSLAEVGLSLLAPDGTVKPFKRFLEDVRKIDSTYNANYLRAEYQHAIGSAIMASRWQQMEKDGDRYDLQYRTAGDELVRESHRLLHGITLPPSDPFWDKYLPPNGWGCRCTAVQVRKGKYPQSDPDLSMRHGDNCTEANKQKIFRFNPGKTLKLFPPQHPYLPKGCDGCEARTQFSYTRGDRDICTTCTQITSYALNQIKNRAVKEMKAQHLPPIKIRSTNYVTGKIFCGNTDRGHLIQHVEDISILPVALDIDNILPTLQDGQREDIVPSHMTPTKERRHVVAYSKYTIIRQVRVNGQTITKTLQLKCEIRRHGNKHIEHPYSIRKLRQ